MDRIDADGLSWVPVRRVFLRRVGFSFAMTFVAMFAVSLAVSWYFGLSIGWGLAGALVLALGFAVEDVMRWRNVRLDHWHLSSGQFIHDGPDGRASVSLADVKGARAHMGARVVITLHSGQRLVMRYLPYPVETAAQIDAAAGPV